MKTSAKQTSLFTEEQLTSSVGDSPANHSVQQGRDKGQRTPGTFGPKCSVLYEKFAPSGSWERMFMDLLIGTREWYSTRCALNWKMKATKSSQLFCHLQVSMPRTKETESSLLPTPRTVDVEGGCAKNVQVENGKYFRENQEGVRWGVKLRDVVESGLLPTPRVKGHGNSHQRIEDGRIDDLTTMAKFGLLPTPSYYDYNTARLPETFQKAKEKWKEKGVNLQEPLKQMAVNGTLPIPEHMMLPTPNSRDWKDNIGNGKDAPSIGQTRGYSLGQKINSMLPTPTARCWNTGTEKERTDGISRRSELNHLVAQEAGKPSLLSPLFVAEMMGFPPDWTILPFQNGETNQ